MKYPCAVVLALVLCFLIGCGERSSEQSPDEPKSVEERGLPGEVAGIEAARPGEKWRIKNRVPLIDEPRDYGAKEEFHKHLVAAVRRGTTIDVLDKTKDGWLKVRTGGYDGSKEGWIAVKNILRAERVSAGE